VGHNETEFGVEEPIHLEPSVGEELQILFNNERVAYVELVALP